MRYLRMANILFRLLLVFSTLLNFPNDGCHPVANTVPISHNSMLYNDSRTNLDDHVSNKESMKSFHSAGNDSNNESAIPCQSDFSIPKNSFHGDEFMCPPCICSRSNIGFKIANCTFRNLSMIPLKLPTDLWSLNISYNHLHSFVFHDLQNYPNLTLLDLSFNKLVSVERCNNSSPNYKLKTLILSSNLIKDISGRQFSSLKDLRELNVANNELNTIEDTAFVKLSNLKILNLSRNKIKAIAKHSFADLIKLSSLSLNNNKLGYFKLDTVNTVGLRILKKLEIQDLSNGDSQYPNQFLGELINLQELHIDVLGGNVEFGKEIMSLKHLKTLKLGPRCFRKNISSTFFKNFLFLEALEISHCKIHYIDPKALSHLPSLRSYKLYFMKVYDLMTAFESLVGLQNASLETIHFVGLRFGSTICRTLSLMQGKWLKNLTLVELNLSYNRLALIREDFLEALPTKTLKTLDLSNNRLTLTGSIWRYLYKFNALEVLIINNQNMNNHAMNEHVIQTDESKNDNWTAKLCESDGHFMNFEGIHTYRNNTYDWREDQDIYPDDIVLDDQSTLKFDVDVYDLNFNNIFRGTAKHNVKHHLLLPPNLRIIVASNYEKFGTVLLKRYKEKHPNKLSELDFSNSYMTDLRRQRLPSNVKKVDLSKNHCSILYSAFFPRRNKLKYLDIKDNYLGPVFSSRKAKYFKNLNQLIYLDISRNLVFDLPKDYFEGLDSLLTFIMRENKLQVFDMTVSHMTKLNFIDLSKNSISWIEQNVQKDLDKLAENHTVRLNIIKNPLPCTCEGLHILEWMSNSKVHFLNKEYLQCYVGDGSIEYIGPLEARIHSMKKKCTSNRDIIVVSFTIAFVFILTIITFKIRWYLIYKLSNDVVGKILGYKLRGRQVTGMTFDAYVFYAQEDRTFIAEDMIHELETKRGHRLCVEDRDFIPGTINFSNIINAVANSTVTLMVISPDLTDHSDFDYALHMSLMEEYYSQVGCYLKVLCYSNCFQSGYFRKYIKKYYSKLQVKFPIFQFLQS